MTKIARRICAAQDCLREKYGIDGYNRLIAKMKNQTGDDLMILVHIYQDNNVSSVVRLTALATMGEQMEDSNGK